MEHLKMDFAVLRSRNADQVRETVVEFVPVEVVDMPTARDSTTGLLPLEGVEGAIPAPRNNLEDVSMLHDLTNRHSRSDAPVVARDELQWEATVSIPPAIRQLRNRRACTTSATAFARRELPTVGRARSPRALHALERTCARPMPRQVARHPVRVLFAPKGQGLTATADTSGAHAMSIPQ